MKRLASVILFLCLAPIVVGIYVSFWGPVPQIPSPATHKFYDYSGALNVHTTSSSGSASISEVTQAANSVGLDFLILTDLNDFTPPVEKEGYVEKVLLLIGGEYSFLGARLLNFDFQTQDHLQGLGRSQALFAEVLQREPASTPAGQFVVTHPLRRGYRLNEIPKGVSGIEVFNLKSIWSQTWQRSKVSFFWSLFLYPFNADLALLRLLYGAGDAEVKYWDHLNSTRAIFGFAGTDAESKIKISKNSILKFPPYESLFRIMRNHVLLRSELTGNAAKDKEKIMDALRLGNFYVSLDLLANPDGFENFLTTKNNLVLLPGSTAYASDDPEMTIVMPFKPSEPFEVVLFKNGERILTSTSLQTTHAIHGPGAYRAEVRLKLSLPLPDGNVWMRWIVSNPFYIK